MSGLAATASVLMASLTVTGCATKAFVRDQTAAVDAKATQVQGTAQEALDRANAAQKLAEGKFMFTTILSDDSVKFARNQHELTQEAQARLSELAQQLKQENRNVYLEIQGHTDQAERNSSLGQERADAVRRYLSQQGVALNRIGTISFGSDQPVSTERTPEARAQNRRVVIIVLS